MFISDWLIIVFGFIAFFLFLWTVRMARRVRRMQRIIRNLEGMDEEGPGARETGDVEGHS